MELKLVPVTEHNWRQATFLTTDPERKIPLDEQWIANNAFSLLQCCYDKDWDCRIMMDGETAVGFVFYGYDRETGHYLLCRYMIDVEHQGKGYGKALLKELARIAVERGCGRMDWVCLDWNQPSIDFYRSLGAVPMDEWTIYRLTGDTLKAVAE